LRAYCGTWVKRRETRSKKTDKSEFLNSDIRLPASDGFKCFANPKKAPGLKTRAFFI